MALERIRLWNKAYPEAVADTHGRGHLLMVEFQDEEIATRVKSECLARGLIVTQTQGMSIRLFPALNTKMEESLAIMRMQLNALQSCPVDFLAGIL